MKTIQQDEGVNLLTPEGREAIKWWFSEDPKTIKERLKYCRQKDKETKKLIEEGYILTSDGIAYTEQGILDGKCPLNGTLYHMGYRRIDESRWRKKFPDED